MAVTYRVKLNWLAIIRLVIQAERELPKEVGYQKLVWVIEHGKDLGLVSPETAVMIAAGIEAIVELLNQVFGKKWANAWWFKWLCPKSLKQPLVKK